MATSSTNTWLGILFLRLVLPLVLVTGVIFRPSGISLLYLLLLVYIPFVPVPTVTSLRGHTGRFLKISLFISFLTVISQIIFQIILLSLPPYGQFLDTCELTEKILRHFGLIRLNELNWIQILKWVGPDAVVLAGTLVVHLVIGNITGEGSQIPPPCPPVGIGGSLTVPMITSTPALTKSHKKHGKGLRILAAVGPYVVLAFLCISSCLEPSIPSAVYYLIFLIGATWWALCQNIKNRFFGILFGVLSVFVLVHLISVYCYQFQWSQELLPPQTLEARLLGFVPLVLTNCTGNSSNADPRDSVFNPNLTWPSFLSPICLMVLFHLLIYEVKTLLRPQDKYYSVTPLVDRRLSNAFMERQHHHRLSRRTTVRWQSTGSGTPQSQPPLKPPRRVISGQQERRRPKKFIRQTSRRLTATFSSMASFRTAQEDVENSNLQNETTPLMTFAPPRRRYSSSVGRSMSGDDGTATALQETVIGDLHPPQSKPPPLTRGISILSKDSGRIASSLSPNEGQDGEYDGYGLLLAALFTLFDLFAKSSYVATNIIMMAWSITYHSWLTFVLLLWACVLWMFPNQRRAMLFSSPGLVIYAELLLLAQYVFSLNLTSLELPDVVDGIDLGEIGLVKERELACLPILVKSLYTGMFWITLRQFVMELREKKASIEHAAQEPFRITVSTAGGSTVPITELRSGPPTRSTYVMKIGTFVRDIMTKFWIWVVAIMLFVIGLGGDKVVLYRIVYMALFLVFILTFQLSYRVWRRMMYGFWLTVIVYSMFVLVMIYTYQFKIIPQLLTNYTAIPKQLQTDIGLEKYDTGDLFVRLLTPTFFVVITVVQLHYFHKDFLNLSEMSRPQDRARSTTSGGTNTEQEPPALIDDFTIKNWLRNLTYHGANLLETISDIYSLVSEFGWRFLEIHIMKIVLFSAFMLSVYDSCAIHFFLFVGIICTMAVTSISVQRLITHICSIYISGLLLTKMIYQIDYIDHSHWNQNCTIGGQNITRNDAEWLGLRKDTDLPHLLKGYIGMILVLTIQAVVHIRQRYQRYMSRMLEPIVGILFPSITRYDADKSIMDCLKFLMNYGFYKFGVEITLVTMVVVIGTRLDAFSVLYSFWLIPMFLMSRTKLSGIWLPFIAFVAVLLPIQYLACVGLPLFLCPEYPWESWPYFDVEELKEWLFLPDVNLPPKATRFIPDFFLLLFACQQQAVFWIEKNIRQDDFPGGSNEELTQMYIPPSENPIPDFLMITRTWLDVIKKCIFLSFYWICLAIIFLTGTNRVNVFALGYLVGSFIFLWEGNEFYLRPRRQIISRWNYLVAFNVFVVFSKSILQLVGCVFSAAIPCWVVQLLGIACLKFAGNASGTMVQGSSNPSCAQPQAEAGLMWDGISFAFLLFQRKIFNSYYFFHIRSETEAQAQLASRGADLISELMQKQIRQQEEQEKDVLEKIKMKMDRIKATHQRGRPREVVRNHFDASSMVSSVSMDEAPAIEPDPPPSPRAPLAVQISTMITSGSGPTPTPSSAAMTLSVDGFFEPPYGRPSYYDQRYSLLQPPPLPLSPSDESFPVFSPPPDDHTTLGRGRMATAGVQTSPPQHRYYYTNAALHSPAPSHHTSIRSGDYYMFDEYDDEELEMIDCITEEEDSDNGKPAGATISELMASALKTGDVEAAAEMARLARRTSVVGDGSLTESTTATSSAPVPRRKSRRRLSRKSYSIRSDRQRQQPTTQPRAREPEYVAPLALSDEDPSGTVSGGRPPDDDGGGGDGFPGGGRAGDTEEQDPSHQPQPAPTIMRRSLGYLRFGWAFMESMMISLTAYLNKFSRDYRHVSRCLALEKKELKEKELTQPPVFSVQSGRPEPLQHPASSEFGDDDVGHIGIDLMKQQSTEESELGGSGDAGSKDDLQTVVEKRSLGKEAEISEASVDEISSTEIISETEYPPIIHLIIATWYVIISHSDLVCYFVVFLNQMKSASLLSLPIPLMVLLWGSLSVPRPTKTFWVTIIAYTEAIVVIKYLFQFDFFPWNDLTLPQKKDPFTPQKILGIEKHAKYAAYDVTLLMVVFFHRFMLKSLGLWKNKSSSGHETTVIVTEEVDSSPTNSKRKWRSSDDDEFEDALMDHSEEAGDEEQLTAGSGGSGDAGCMSAWDEWHVQQNLSYGPTILKLCVLQYLSSIRVFFKQIMNMEYKVKVDVYSYMFMCDFFNFLVLIFGFSAFGSQQSDVTSYLEENKVPVPFLVMVILQFALIVIDRALYLRKYILGKFFYQLFLITFVHIAMFFILPAVTEQEFNARIPPQMWYMVKCIYLLFSAYQIRSGYPTRILGNFLCKKYNYVNMFLFKGFMAVPFLFELRALMDWIWTDTSMTLSDWLKLEDIFAHVFQLKCQRRVEKEYPQGRGMPKARWSKYAIGGSSLFIIIAIIWFPLVFFALGNTVGLPNRPKEMAIELSIGSYQPIFTMSAQSNSLKNFTIQYYDKMNTIFRGERALLNFVNGYEYEDIVTAQFDGNSDAVWGISPPSKEKLLKELRSNESVSVRFSWTIQRETANPSLGNIVKAKLEVNLEPGGKNRLQLVEMINGSAEEGTEITIPKIFPKFLKITNLGKAGVADAMGEGTKKDYSVRSLKLKLKGTGEANEKWWDVEEVCSSEDRNHPLPYDDHCENSNLNTYTFNEKSFPPTLNIITGGGILGLYTTLVLVASKFVRGFFSGISFLIMFDDMPNVDRLFQLCLDIYLVRESKELALEEDLFAKMIFLYRSPETLIKWTRPKTTPPNGQIQPPEAAEGPHPALPHAGRS